MSKIKTLRDFTERQMQLLEQEAQLWREFSLHLLDLEDQFKPPEPIIQREIKIIEKEESKALPNKAMLTEREAGQYLSSSTHTLQKWRRTGEGPKYVKVGRSVRYPLKSIEEYVQKQTYSNTVGY